MAQRNFVNEEELRTTIESYFPQASRIFSPRHVESLTRLARRMADEPRSVMGKNSYIRRTRREHDGDPPWVSKKLREGGKLYRFYPEQAGPFAERVSRVFEAASEIESLAESDEPAQLSKCACKLLDGINHHSPLQFEVGASELLLDWEIERRFCEQIYRGTKITRKNGKFFRRIRSLEELDQIGKEAQNCLRKSHGYHREHWKRFLSGECEVWVLRSRGQIRAVLRVDVEANVIDELKASHNKDVPPRYRPDILAFVRWRGLIESEPTIELGITKQTIHGDQRPKAKGTIDRKDYKICYCNGEVRIQHGVNAPDYAVFRIDPNKSNREQGLVSLRQAHAGGTLDNWTLIRRIIADAGSRMKSPGPTFAKLQALASMDARGVSRHPLSASLI